MVASRSPSVSDAASTEAEATSFRLETDAGETEEGQTEATEKFMKTGIFCQIDFLTFRHFHKH